MIPTQVKYRIAVGVDKTSIHIKYVSTEIAWQKDFVVFVDRKTDYGVQVIEISTVGVVSSL